ncbi:LOW QUALITY PROTEIN: endoribonuclease Dicer-like [Acropora millepora]|uniref:LOW QUALITY PROTEIN: endoribonuclease Dicer-like n=1 Tax=Acropora millepora TaxID=45264 RepID=UPI001CF45231|nr:LOW QUALITY PROTEIN: endoribonuclease Dicer-like [Acropora millepora]
MGVDYWNKVKWEEELNKNNVLVMTAQIFLHLLHHAYIKLTQVNLLIFDECHHAKKGHPYRQITQAFHKCEGDLPKIMGLTASVVKGKVKPQNVELEIKTLERTLRATCETSQDKEVERFATTPKEEVVTFSTYENNDDLDILKKCLQVVLDQGLHFLDDFQEPHDSLFFAQWVLKECKEILSELGPWAANKAAELLIKDLGRACYTYDTHGTEGRLFCEFSAAQLRQLQSVYRNYLSNSGGDLENSEQFYIMPKLQKLLMVLKEYRTSNANETEQDNKLCGIVFVERRYTAKILSEQINFAAKLDHELSFVQSDFVIGHGTGGRVNFSTETEMNFKKQENVLRQFRQHTFNLLIATMVVEEGLDIPKCNLVCRFDFPKTFCSYVQSKGRARAKDSCYYLLVDSQEEMEKRYELETMQEIENVLSEMCHDRDEPTAEECDEAADTDFLPPFQPPNGGGARLTMSSSISLLSRYCSKLPGDRFTALKPVYKIQELGKDAYECKLEMPTTCPLRTTIIGCPMPRKNLSKMAAAYQACKKLYEMGELAENLLPVLSESDDESETEEEVEPGSDEKKKAKAGTKKRKRVYDRKIPEAFIGSLVQQGKPQYLTVINIRVTKLTQQDEFELGKRLFTDNICNNFGLLTNVPLPAVRSFKLYPNYGEVTVSLCSSTALRFMAPSSMQNQETARKFHCFLFSHILREEVEIKPKNPDGEADGYFIVLVKKSGRDVDYGAMKEAMGLVNPRYTRSVEEDMVVTRNDQDFQESKLQRIAVLRVRHDLSPLSPFPYRSNSGQRYKSYWEYFGERFKLTDQPLIKVKPMSSRVNFLVDRKRESITEGFELFPELCEVFTIRASLLSVSLLLPSILHRVNALYLVGDVKSMIAGVRDETDESGLPSIGAKYATDEMRLLHGDEDNVEEEMPMIDDDSSKDDDDEEGSEEGELMDDDEDLKEFSDLFSELKSMFSSSRGPPDHPDTALVLQALTTTHSVDAFHLERLEMLGDAFLKLAVSLHLFWNYQDKDEGKLTVRKVRQISNKALYHAAVKTKLAGYQQCTQLARDNWCPTGSQFRKPPPETTPSSGDAVKGMDIDSPTTVDAEMEVEGAVGEDSQSVCESAAKPDIQVIADKSVADSMEALIGAYLISCGYVGALRFLKFLGLKVLPDDADQHTIEISLAKSKAGRYAPFWEQPESNMRGAGDNAAMAARLESGLENFEENSIRYRFRSKLYLVEALTHASYHPNRVTPCYQRLEFLGDAVLDFLVTQHLFLRHGKLSPGELTDIRQALVNNHFFAVIAVKNNFNKYLKQMSPTLFKTIEKFVTFMDEENEEKEQNRSNEASADPFIIVSEETAAGIEAPKVLGDIFESVAGAVFLDSGMDLTKIWGVYYRMMKPYIDDYSVNIPMSPIREVRETSKKVECSEPEKLPNGKIQRTLQVDWGEFVGSGLNSKIAKATAAKLALLALKRNQIPASQENE